MKNILCFGDSNTWGYEPGTEQRYSGQVRWTGVLQSELGAGFRVIEEGLNGRTTNVDEQGRSDRNGARLLPVLLESHRPLDLVVIMLGTNDLKTLFERSARDIAMGVRAVCEKVLNCECLVPNVPEVLLVSPALVKNPGGGEMGEMEGAVEKSREFSGHFRHVADELGVRFFDAGPVVEVSPQDGVHWEAEEHRKFGRGLAMAIRDIFGPGV
jgi:lysophospholipase L1-like esterase